MTDLLKYKKYLIAVLIALVAIIVIWGVVKFSGLGDKINDKLAERKLGTTLDAEISKAGIVTMSPAEAQNAADKLYQAMKGPGTDEDAIYEVFNNIDSLSNLLYLIKIFGVRNSLTLNEWLTSELNAKERTKLNSIIARNNIGFKF